MQTCNGFSDNSLLLHHAEVGGLGLGLAVAEAPRDCVLHGLAWP